MADWRWTGGRGQAYGKCTYEHIAEIVGMTQMAVRKRASRGEFDLKDFHSVWAFLCKHAK